MLDSLRSADRLLYTHNLQKYIARTYTSDCMCAGCSAIFVRRIVCAVRGKWLDGRPFVGRGGWRRGRTRSGAEQSG
ncbi:hypothetical protein M5D96_000528 [Drosophila gunungcola]|uniref:Uncharacterized protein n=1 Tax=Drosophila gunungcola TaxID=103775 RepID=A0A9Q0BTQ5_9MUSC|nr:hypothetical protein M5D96_000528 [Drosophila gunungcola]